MIRTFFFILVAVLTFACTHNNEDINVSGETKKYKADLKEVKKDSELVVLVENSAISYFVYRGKPLGYEYEVLKMYADHLGVKLKIKVVHDLDKIIEMLNNGKGDLIACNYTITDERKESISFSSPYILTRQVLVQRKPQNWRELKEEELEDSLIRHPKRLKGKTIHAWANSTYFKRLTELEQKYGDMQVVPTSGELESEALIRQVSQKKIDYTVIDDNVAKVNSRFYPNIDIKTPVSDEQKIAFGLRQSSPNLKENLNRWLKRMKKNSEFRYLKHKYFKINSYSGKSRSDFASTKSGQISPYDDIIKAASDNVGWDWLLAASLIYQESKFNNNSLSWAGAFGIMQFMPATGAEYGLTPQSSVSKQIYAGLKKLNYHYENWLERVTDSSEAVKFTLATYNAGLGHVLDAKRLAKKYGKNQYVWDDNVEGYMLKLSRRKYYADPVVRYGYMRGIETFNYVNQIVDRYENYRNVYQ